ncbi:Serine/threonine-protein kinase HRK1 [Smittium mucronatum]|uniref:Serine/threonine-protein kinase HRK1 n=1 Tax=Smittium mucronatum TaxID=133383 RepID=A0A1R0H1T6_9FUNG|nr:Serine/threonine-protein kinase HRK1 [Smittium mucronatum]
MMFENSFSSNNINHVSPTVTLYEERRPSSDRLFQKALNSMKTIFKSDFLPKKSKFAHGNSKKGGKSSVRESIEYSQPCSNSKTVNQQTSINASPASVLKNIVQIRPEGYLVGRFGRPVRSLGSGADGSVDMHIDASGNKYAIKTFKSIKISSNATSLGDVIDNRTANEILINSRIDHPNVVRALACFVELGSNSVHLVMEYCERDLFSLVMDLSDSSSGDNSFLLNRLFYQLISTIQFLHNTARIAHRDIKLDNVLIDSENNVKLADFGCSVVLNGSTVTGLCGSDPYIGPEVFVQGLQYDPTKVDIWSLAVVYLAMVSGRFPWEISQSRDKNFNYFCSSPVKFIDFWLESTQTFIPDSAKDLILSMLSLDPSARPSIDEVTAHPFFQYLDATYGQ